MVQLALSDQEWRVLWKLAKRAYPRTTHGLVQTGSAASDMVRLGLFHLGTEIWNLDLREVEVEEEAGADPDLEVVELFPQRKWKQGSGRVRSKQLKNGRFWRRPAYSFSGGIHGQRKKELKYFPGSRSHPNK